jgi:CheY-like chemotaxis protein
MSDLLHRTLGETIEIKTVLAERLWLAEVDPNQLEMAILNLTVNARDAMPRGGVLTIETGNTHLDRDYVALHAEVSPGEYVAISVSDTGAGMSADVLSRVFEPFFTTKDVGRGTGLGLSQVYGFVSQSGGEVQIYSEVGVGTTVKVYLPRFTGAWSDRADNDGEAVQRAAGREVVLVVEDEGAVRQVSVEALKELGYEVLQADGGAAALKLLDKHPEVVLLFTDVIMPDMNGRKLADEALRRRPGLKVLFTTGYTSGAVVHNGVLDPGVEMISKPFTVEDLAAHVRRVLDQGPGITND